MADFAVVLARSARRELEALLPPILGRVIAGLDTLARDPRPRGARKLRGPENFWSMRVGDYRIVYGIDDRAHVVDVVRIRHRRDVYDV